MATSPVKIINDFVGLSGKLGILGGSFDPVHNAHLAMARAVKQHYSLDHLLFIPTFRNPLKASPGANPKQRLEMLSIALGQDEKYLISSIEIDRQSLYSIDTVLAINEQAPAVSEIYLIHGSDCLASLHKWHKINELLGLVNFVIVDRAGQLPELPLTAPGLEEKQIEKLLKFHLELALPEISASAIRGQISRGEQPTNMLAPGVFEYIQAKRLYGYPSE